MIDMQVKGRSGSSYGSRNGHSTMPHRTPRGFKRKPESIMRGEKNGRAKLTLAQAKEVRAMFDAGETRRSIAGRLGMSYCYICEIIRGEKRVDA
jgi:hypothetical protein